MLVVPINGDIVTTSEDAEFEVIGFTNFKKNGPAVYGKKEGMSKEDATLIYFFDIKNLNGIKVEFNNTSKVLNALGLLKRKVHLPQKDDEIEVDDKHIKVKELKLHNKNIGLSRGLIVIGDDKVEYSLSSINTITRTHGDSFFDKKLFLKMYKDYLGYSNAKHEQ